MTSVTSRIKDIKQPRGGYIKPSAFEKTVFDDGATLNEHENIHASVVGITVDYLSRVITGTDPINAFQISLAGAKCAEDHGRAGSLEQALILAASIEGVDPASVISACKLATFDIWFRNPSAAAQARSVNETNPDLATIANIQTMVLRAAAFFNQYGPVIQDGFDFLPVSYTQEEALLWTVGEMSTFGGYTQTVSAGDGDFLTVDTLWDLKVSKNKPTSAHTLQLLMYWIMGQHSGQDIYKNISKIGIFNPRLNTMYRLDMANIPKETIEIVEQDVIGY